MWRTTRRGLFGWLAAGVAARPQTRGDVFPTERARYFDPATGFPVLRLTSPAHTSWLPPPWLRAVSKRRAHLLFSNGRSGPLQPCLMVLNTGEQRLLAAPAALDPSSLTLTPDDRGVFFFDGPALNHVSLATLRQRQVYRVREGWERVPGFSVSPDGSRAAIIEASRDVRALRLLPLLPNAADASTVMESPAPIRAPLFRPGHDDLLYRTGENSLALTGRDGRNPRPVLAAQGRVGPHFWSANGERIQYLCFPAEAGKTNEIRELLLDGNADRLVASTSQFVSFAPNHDSSVFAGASASKASPYVLLLLRVTRRELALCEHRASDAAAVMPVFSPDSQRIYFQSDRDGQMAIYAMALEKLVERTEG